MKDVKGKEFVDVVAKFMEIVMIKINSYFSQLINTLYVIWISHNYKNPQHEISTHHLSRKFTLWRTIH